MRRMRLGLILCCVTALLAAACAEVMPQQAAPKVNATPVGIGWSGLAWGTTLGQFKAKYPSFQVGDVSTGSAYRTGEGAQRFLGLDWLVVYNFNPDKRLEGVKITCVGCGSMRATVALRKKYGRPILGTNNWRQGDVLLRMIGYDTATVIVSNKRFATEPEVKGKILKKMPNQ